MLFLPGGSSWEDLKGRSNNPMNSAYRELYGGYRDNRMVSEGGGRGDLGLDKVMVCPRLHIKILCQELDFM